MCKHNYQKTGKSYIESSTMRLMMVYKCNKCGNKVHKEDDCNEFFNEIFQEKCDN